MEILLTLLPIDIAGGVVVYWLVLGMLSLLLIGSPKLITQLIFPAGALGALLFDTSESSVCSRTVAVASRTCFRWTVTTEPAAW